MINKNYVTLLVIITIGLIFFQDIALILGKQVLYLAPFFIIAVLVICFFINFKKFVNTIIMILKDTPYKYLILYVLWVIISSFFVGNITTSMSCILRALLIYGLTVIPAVLFYTYISRYKLITPEKLIKIFIAIYLFIMLYGIFHYIVQALHIDFLSSIHKLFCTKQLFSNADSDYATFRSLRLENHSVRGMSIFFEASFLATFIFVFMPFLYKIAGSRIQIIKSNILDKCMKLSMVFLSWLNLILTLSPIYIIACILYTLVYFYNKLARNTKRFFSVISIGFILMSIIIFSNFADLSSLQTDNKVLNRIVKTVSAIGSVDNLVQNEASLATRLIANYNGLMVCINHHPIIGTGYGNAKELVKTTMASLDIPLTEEIILVTFTFDIANAPPSIFFSVVCQTGLVGVFLLYLFIAKTILEAKKVKKYFINNNRLLLEISYLISINFVIVSFYWSFESYPMMWFILGILLSYILLFNTKIKKRIVATRQLLSANKEEH